MSIVEGGQHYSLIVGLGNPGNNYARTRHNIGFMLVDKLAEHYGAAPFKARFSGLWSEIKIDQQKLYLFKPQQFMNCSGPPVAEAAKFFKFSPATVLVVHDELDIPPATLKMKQGGGSGGHNGLKSLDAHFGKDYWRLRLGIGHPRHKDMVSGYVLSPFANDEHWVSPLLEQIVKYFPRLVSGDIGGFSSMAQKGIENGV
ncbi:MAG: aminoacyl-tRNA hydrolase [Alphaproteobacteria bacterium]